MCAVELLVLGPQHNAYLAVERDEDDAREEVEGGELHPLVDEPLATTRVRVCAGDCASCTISK